jgi:hypothetical protein
MQIVVQGRDTDVPAAVAPYEAEVHKRLGALPAQSVPYLNILSGLPRDMVVITTPSWINFSISFCAFEHPHTMNTRQLHHEAYFSNCCASCMLAAITLADLAAILRRNV